MVGLPILAQPVRYTVAVAVAVLILYASVTTPPDDAAGWTLLGVASDKWLHALAYAALVAVLGYASLAADARALALVVVVAVAYGVGVEFVQSFLPTRTASLVDALADAVGATVGAVVWRAVAERVLIDRR